MLTFTKTISLTMTARAFTLSIVITTILAYGCSEVNNTVPVEKPRTENSQNPAVYFEIPVTDMDRAMAFYRSLFHYQFEQERIDDNDMALFPFRDSASGISGALAKGKTYKPSLNGTLIYFSTGNIDSILQKCVTLGRKVLYPKTRNEYGYVAEFQDSEGNRIGLFETY